jgi:hypothetical protein
MAVHPSQAASKVVVEATGDFEPLSIGGIGHDETWRLQRLETPHIALFDDELDAGSMRIGSRAVDGASVNVAGTNGRPVGPGGSASLSP